MMLKIGPKQKHLEVPKGWFVVHDGFCHKGDMFANVGNPNKPFWSLTEEDDWGVSVEAFDVLIRKEEFCLS